MTTPNVKFTIKMREQFPDWVAKRRFHDRVVAIGERMSALGPALYTVVCNGVDPETIPKGWTHEAKTVRVQVVSGGLGLAGYEDVTNDGVPILGHQDVIRYISDWTFPLDESNNDVPVPNVIANGGWRGPSLKEISEFKGGGAWIKKLAKVIKDAQALTRSINDTERAARGVIESYSTLKQLEAGLPEGAELMVEFLREMYPDKIKTTTSKLPMHIDREAVRSIASDVCKKEKAA